MREHILKILAINGIDPDEIMDNGQTAYQFLEGRINGALDEME